MGGRHVAAQADEQGGFLMEYAICLLVIFSIGCGAWILLQQPSVALPTPARPTRFGMTEGLSMMWQEHRLLKSVLAGLGRLVPPLGRYREGLRGQLVYTGVRLTAEQLAGLQILAAMASVLVYLSVAKEFHRVDPIVLCVVAAAGFILPHLWLKAKVRARQRAIVRLLPEVTDLLALCVGAGLDFLGSLNKVVMVKAFREEALIEELSFVLQEIKLGKRRFEALKAMAQRVNVPEVSSFVRTLVQADRMGTPIAEVLAVHSEDVRFERFTRAERAALKAPIKILIPLIFFIMPCVALTIGAPIFIQFMTNNPFAK